jgi:hypothetical protein
MMPPILVTPRSPCAEGPDLDDPTNKPEDRLLTRLQARIQLTHFFLCPPYPSDTRDCLVNNHSSLTIAATSTLAPQVNH